jgi:hypothetical protein
MRVPMKIAIPATAAGAMVVGGWALLPAATSGASAPTRAPQVATPIVAPLVPARMVPAQTATPEPSPTASESESPEPATPEPAGDTYADPPGDVNHECPPTCGPGETP